MLALRFYGQRDIRLEEIPPPAPQQDEVLIQVTAAGISQTQINEFVEGPFVINSTPHPLTGKSIPLIPSQEYGGIIVDVGKNVDTSLIGKKVAVLPLIACHECDACKKGAVNLCEKIAYHGLLGADGGFCELSVVHKDNIYPIDNEDLLTFVEPILVALHAAAILRKFSPYTQKNSILILGAGAIGVAIAAVLLQMYGATCTIYDILPSRLERAKSAGLATIKNPQKGAYDIVIDAAGMDTLVSNPALLQAPHYLKKSGLILNIGSYFHPIAFTPSQLLLHEQHLITSFAYDTQSIQDLAHFLQVNTIDFSHFIESISLQNIIEEGYIRAEVYKDSFTRLVVRPHHA